MRTLIKMSVFLLFLLISLSSASPLNRSNENEFNNLTDEDYSSDNEFINDMKLFELEKHLDNILDEYYDKYIEPTLREKAAENAATYFEDIDDEEMMNDMPIAETETDAILNTTDTNANSTTNFQIEREKSKNDWIHHIKTRVLSETGRNNTTEPISSEFMNKVKQTLLDAGISNPGFTRVGPVMKGGEYTEKIRSFYPSCEIPRNTDEEIWKDMNTMNLFFNVSYNSGSASTSATGQQEDTVNIASATLRLYRIPQDITTNLNINCKSAEGPHALNDDDKQIRVSVYWYSRSLKKHKVVKKRLADSHMVPLMDTTGGTQYLEFNIRPATRSWVKGRNLGLGVVVEDMDGTILATEKHFKGLGCDMVGNVSTPKPIPTVVLDTLGFPNRNGPTDNSTDRNTNAFNTFMPKIDICIIELPAELAAQGTSAIDAHSVFCKQLNSNNHKHNAWQKLFGSTTVTTKNAPSDTSITISDTGRHIRHQHQPHHSITSSDLRNKMISKRLVLTKAELETLSRQIQSQNVTRNSNR